jgi:hypothetical protein
LLEPTHPLTHSPAYSLTHSLTHLLARTQELQGRLNQFRDYDDVKQELAIMKSLEFAADPAKTKEKTLEVLCYAVLCGAVTVLCCAVLCCAVLCCDSAVLCCAVLCCVNIKSWPS